MHQPEDEPGSSSDAIVIDTVSVAALLELAGMSSIAPSLSDAGFEDDCLAQIIVELNHDWDSGVTLLHDLLQETDLSDKAIPGQLLGALRAKALSQPQSALETDTERPCRSLGDEVAEGPARDQHPAPTAAVSANESVTHNVPMLAVPTLRRDSGGVVKAPKGSSFRDRMNAQNQEGFTRDADEEEAIKILKLKWLNAELCTLQEKLLLSPRADRKELKKEADYVERKIWQWSGVFKFKFADDAVVYDRPAEARSLQPLARGTAEVSECGATLSGQGTFNSAEDFAKWLAVSGGTALKAPNSPHIKKKKERRETAGPESPQSHTDRALAGEKTFTPPVSALTQESHEVGAPSATMRHCNPLSTRQLTEDQDAAPPPHNHFGVPHPTGL